MNVFKLMEELKALEYEHFVGEKMNIPIGEVPSNVEVFLGKEPIKFIHYDPTLKRIVLQ